MDFYGKNVIYENCPSLILWEIGKAPSVIMI